MGIKLDDDLLKSLGLDGLHEQTKAELLRAMYESLEYRVGTTLASSLSDEQLAEFESLVDHGGDQGVTLAWLQKNVPTYKTVVNTTFRALRAEVLAGAPEILAKDQMSIGGAA